MTTACCRWNLTGVSRRGLPRIFAAPHALAHPGAFRLPRWLLGPVLPGLVLLVSAACTHAHRGHAVWTDIHWAEDRFEIVHRMHVPDAISVNQFMGGSQPIEELRSLALVALYVEERFSLIGAADEERAVFDTIGAEIVDGFVYVYQEWSTPLPAGFPDIDNRVLLDVEPGSQAFIKIKAPGLDEERVR